MKDREIDLNAQMLSTHLTTRRGFLKTAGSLGLLAVAHPLITSCGGSSRGTPDYSRTIAEMTTFIDGQMAANKVKGLAIALVDDQRTVWARGFGKADVANDIPATADTHFEIGSNSKTFAGVMIAQLVERGLLSIDDPLTNYLPDFRIGAPLGFPAGGPVTIRSMLTHHSGIPGDVMNGGFTFGASRPDLNQRLLDYLANDHLAYPAGLIEAYSNTAAALLASVIASASRVSFPSYAETLFQALGMDRTSFDSTSPKVTNAVSKGYKNDREEGPFTCNLGTAGSIISTANDMAKYLKMIMAGGMGERARVMDVATVEMMLTRQPSLPLDCGTDRGFLWGLRAFGFDYAGKTCDHSGGTMTMCSYMVVLREHKLAAVVLSNTAEAAMATGEIIIRALRLALEEKTGTTPPGPFVPVYSPPATWPQATLDGLSGIYVALGSVGGYLKIVSVPGALEWTNAGDTIRIIPRANGWLSAADSQMIQYQFTVIEGRNVILHRLAHPTFGERTEVFAEKHNPSDIPDPWKHERIGVWEAINLDPADFQLHITGGGNPTLQLSLTDGMLILTSTSLVSGGTFVIQPVDNTQGYACGLGRRGGSAVKVFAVAGQDELQFLGIKYRKK